MRLRRLAIVKAHGHKARWPWRAMLLVCLIALLSCCQLQPPSDDLLWIEHQGIALAVDANANFVVLSRQGDGWRSMSRLSAEAPTHQIITGDGAPMIPAIDLAATVPQDIATAWGKGRRWTLRGESTGLRQTIVIESYVEYPQTLLLQASYENTGQEALTIRQLTQDQLVYASPSTKSHEVWAFGGASWRWGQKIVFPLEPGLEHANYLGQVESGEGGGIPLVYVWDERGGMALAHLEMRQQAWHMPLEVDGGGRTALSLQQREPITLQPGQSYQGLRTMISVHRGDYYDALRTYARLMAAQGWHLADPSPEAYEPVWCGWGYEFNFSADEMLGVVPMLEDLGIRWAALDDRWFDAYGDWNPREDTFPAGEESIKRLVDAYHQAGIKVQLWWYPLAAEDDTGAWPSHAYYLSDVVRAHPDWLILDEKGEHARNNRNLAILCPALPEVQAYTVDLVQRFIGEWGFDGHKLDNVYTVPPCYNRAHGHASPDESVQALPEVYRLILETTRGIRPDGVTMLSPCGSTPNVYLMPYVDQPMMSDPFGSWQVRMRIKVLKALIGPDAPVFADHVELTDDGADFVSMVAPGGVPGTKFVWPRDHAVEDRLIETYYLLDEGKAAHWKEWMETYRELDLARGEYLNVYDTIYDVPEGHVVSKDGRLFYSFFADFVGDEYKGSIVLRGLEAGRRYRLVNYENGKEIGIVRGPEARLRAEFQSHVLIQATPD